VVAILIALALLFLIRTGVKRQQNIDLFIVFQQQVNAFVTQSLDWKEGLRDKCASQIFCYHLCLLQGAWTGLEYEFAQLCLSENLMAIALKGKISSFSNHSLILHVFVKFLKLIGWFSCWE